MFKKMSFLTGLFIVLASAGMLHALSEGAQEGTNQPRRDVWAVGGDVSTSVYVGVDHDGDILPSRNLYNDLGEGTRAWKKVYAGSVDTSSGLVNFTETYINVTSSDPKAMALAGFVVSTRTLTSLENSATTYSAGFEIRQPSGAPRNLIIYSSASKSSDISTTSLIMSVTIYGYNNKGEWTTENIMCSTTPAVYSTNTFTNAGTNFVLGIGSVAWSYIDHFTAQITSMTDAFGLNTNESPLLFIGVGLKIGLPNNIAESTDVYKVTQNLNDVTNRALNPALTINTTYDTVVFPTNPNGAITYKVWARFKRMW